MTAAGASALVEGAAGAAHPEAHQVAPALGLGPVGIAAATVADAPVVFLSHGLRSVLVSPQLENYVLTPFSVRQWHLLDVNRD